MKNLVTSNVCRTDDYVVNTLIIFQRQRIAYKTLVYEFSYTEKTHSISKRFKVITINSVYLIKKNILRTETFF